MVRIDVCANELHQILRHFQRRRNIKKKCKRRKDAIPKKNKAESHGVWTSLPFVCVVNVVERKQLLSMMVCLKE